MFLHDGLAAMAAAYLFHIAKNHPFIDGNKRTAAVAARAFVLINGGRFDPPESEFERTTLAVAASEMDKEQLTQWFQIHVRPLDG